MKEKRLQELSPLDRTCSLMNFWWYITLEQARFYEKIACLEIGVGLWEGWVAEEKSKHFKNFLYAFAVFQK